MDPLNGSLNDLLNDDGFIDADKYLKFMFSSDEDDSSDSDDDFNDLIKIFRPSVSDSSEDKYSSPSLPFFLKPSVNSYF